MSNEFKKAPTPSESAPIKEWWKNPDATFQVVLVKWSLAFVQGFLEKEDDQRIVFALNFVKTFRREVEEVCQGVVLPQSDEAVMQILMIVARERVERS